MNRSVIKKFGVVSMTFAAAFACAKSQNVASTVVNAVETEKTSTAPFVDAYIQFIGPDARWLGPALWTVHVSTRDSQAPVFQVNPALPRVESGEGPEVTNRQPASQGAAPVVFTNEQVRDRLQHLGSVVEKSTEESGACAQAVRVRLTRADGSMVEKQACRGSVAWTLVASEVAAEFMDQSRYPRPVTEAKKDG